MKRIIGRLGLHFTTKTKTAASGTQTACTDMSPHSYRVTAPSGLATETIKIFCDNGFFEELTTALLPERNENLITLAMVKRCGMAAKIHDLEPAFSSQITINGFDLRVMGYLGLWVSFQQAGNGLRSWDVKFVVVEELWAGIGVTLGEETCEKANIVRGPEYRPHTIKNITEEERKKRDEDRRKAQELAAAEIAAQDRERLAKMEEETEGAGNNQRNRELSVQRFDDLDIVD